MKTIAERPSAEVDLALIRRLDGSGPRYTSYPTADRFVEAFGPETYASWAGKRNIGGVHRTLSLYVHLPFCSTVCLYCACNRVITRDPAKGRKYLDYLAREIALQAPLFRDDPVVTQIHCGGGTPTFFSPEDLGKLFALLRANFWFALDGEYSIEIDPRTVDADSVAMLRAIGFNRLSIGVQDFDPDVQRAVNRVQSPEHTFEVMAAARRAGFESLNVDLIYALPKQNLAGFGRTLEQVIGARPDRVAIYNYAHLPARFRAQRRIAEADLPPPEIKLKLLATAVRRLLDAGYVYIGMDHFARPEDALAVAQRQGRLHRNFQGYSTQPDCDLVGLGMSAIGSIGPTYSQNQRTLPEYYASLEHGTLPVMRGVELTADDLVRRAVIHALMCNFAVSKESIEVAHLVDFDRYFRAELAELVEFERLGVVALDERWISVTARGRLVIRSVCMVFDRYLRRERDLQRYSRLI